MTSYKSIRNNSIESQSFSSTADFPSTGISPGTKSYDESTDTLFVWNGQSWMKLDSETTTRPSITKSFEINVINSGASAYSLTGNDRLGSFTSENNRKLAFFKGDTVTFNINSPGHPFWIKTVRGGGTDFGLVGVENNGIDVGTITFTVPDSFQIFYICQFHNVMSNEINILRLTENLEYYIDIRGGLPVDSGNIRYRSNPLNITNDGAIFYSTQDAVSLTNAGDFIIGKDKEYTAIIRAENSARIKCRTSTDQILGYGGFFARGTGQFYAKKGYGTTIEISNLLNVDNVNFWKHTAVFSKKSEEPAKYRYFYVIDNTQPPGSPSVSSTRYAADAAYGDSNFYNDLTIGYGDTFASGGDYFTLPNGSSVSTNPCRWSQIFFYSVELTELQIQQLNSWMNNTDTTT